MSKADPIKYAGGVFSGDPAQVAAIGELSSAAIVHHAGRNEAPRTTRGRAKGSRNCETGGRGFMSDRKVPLFDIADTRKVRLVTPAIAAIYYRASAALTESARQQLAELSKGGRPGALFAGELTKTLNGSGSLFAIGSAFERAWAAKNWTEFGAAIEVAERLAILALDDPAACVMSRSFARWAATRANTILRRRGASTPREDGSKPVLPAPEVTDAAYTAGLVEFGSAIGVQI